MSTLGKSLASRVYALFLLFLFSFSSNFFAKTLDFYPDPFGLSKDTWSTIVDFWFCMTVTSFRIIVILAKHVPLKQWTYDDSNSPKYQKFKIDRFPKIIYFEKQDYLFLIECFDYKYGKRLTPVHRRNGKSIPETITCPRCGATREYLYDNNGGNGQFQSKICSLILMKTIMLINR